MDSEMHGENINFPKYSFVSLMILQSAFTVIGDKHAIKLEAQPYNLNFQLFHIKNKSLTVFNDRTKSTFRLSFSPKKARAFFFVLKIVAVKNSSSGFCRNVRN